MSNTTVRSVHDIGRDTRACLESLLGQELRDEQQVFLMVFTPGAALDTEVRRCAAARIIKTLDAAETDAALREINADEADEAVAEAVEHVRRLPS